LPCPRAGPVQGLRGGREEKERKQRSREEKTASLNSIGRARGVGNAYERIGVHNVLLILSTAASCVIEK
jgi:hypothetical protein